MTLDLGPTAPTTGFPACRDSNRKLLTDVNNPGAVRRTSPQTRPALSTGSG